jgi:hypothetical protein
MLVFHIPEKTHKTNVSVTSVVEQEMKGALLLLVEQCVVKNAA